MCFSNRETACSERKEVGVLNHNGAYSEYVILVALSPRIELQEQKCPSYVSSQNKKIIYHVWFNTKKISCTI